MMTTKWGFVEITKGGTMMDIFLIVTWVLTIAAVAYAVGLFVYLLKTRYEFIKLGKKVEFDESVKERISQIMEKVFGQSKLLKDKKSGAMHVMFFYGFLLVQLGAIDLIIRGLAPDHHLPLGPLYGPFVFFEELVALMILVAVAMAFHRRYVEKLVRLKRGWKNGLVLIFIGGLMLSTLLANGFAMIWHEHTTFNGFEPVASTIMLAFSWLPPAAGMVMFYVSWWVHLLILLTFLVYVPQ